MASEVLGLHLGLLVRGEVLGVKALPLVSTASTATTTSTSNTTAPSSPSHSGGAQLLQAAVRLQLLSLGLLTGDVGAHGVVVRWTNLTLPSVNHSSSTSRSCSSSTLLLLLLLLLQYIVAVHLLLQEALQYGAPAASSSSAHAVVAVG